MRVPPLEVARKVKAGESLQPQDWTPADQAAWFDADFSEKINFVKNRNSRLTKKSPQLAQVYISQVWRKCSLPKPLIDEPTDYGIT